MGCISTPIPNYLSTLKPHHNRVENTLQNNKNHTKRVEGKKSDVEKVRMRRMVRSVDEKMRLSGLVG